jgi:hypothetical protein
MRAEEALAVGLVSELAESDALLERACELARRFTAMPPRGVGMTKRALEASLRSTLPQQLQHEREMQAVAIRRRRMSGCTRGRPRRSGRTGLHARGPGGRAVEWRVGSIGRDPRSLRHRPHAAAPGPRQHRAPAPDGRSCGPPILVGARPERADERPHLRAPEG